MPHPALRPSPLAGGVSSPVRSGRAVGGAPFVQVAGRGAYAYDRDGRPYVDYVMAYGPLLFGHAHPALVRGLDELAASGTVFGSTSDEELRLAARITTHLPSIEQLRFVSTGTEAMMSAVRVARAYTRRPLVVRFAGNYHGHFDAALQFAGASAQTESGAGSGIPARASRDVVVARYNDLGDFDVQLAGRGDELAAIVLEPVAANMGLVVPDRDFIDGIFARARSAGALVVFDEVITWLRVGLGGAQAQRQQRPDLTALGKIAGGGLPLAAFGGRADVMAALAPGGESFSGGTFSGNPFCVGLAHRVLDLLEGDGDFHARLAARACELADGIRATFARRGIPYSVTQHASMVDFAFRCGAAARNYDERLQSDRVAFAAYYHAMRDRGVLLAPSPNELMFLSSEHGPDEIALTIEALDESFASLQRSRLV
ncbi:MAG: glutamate-1-semialdehyde 2,1-aminomutase [Candidatus Eremiobacteraeota bacterium]|nr:glutamate-1-semialdehyde 2,1-aminomutase [Candidatus Eremiobacteraeota bacterium]